MKSPSFFRLFAILFTGAFLAFGAPARADSHGHGHGGDHHDFHGHDDHGHFYGGHGHFWPHLGFGFGYYPGYYGWPYYGGYYGGSYGSYYDPYYYGDSYYPHGRIYRGAVVGDSGGLVVDVQRALKHRGYSPGPIDGIVGIGTRAAIRVYQADHHLPVTGRIDGELVHALGLT